MRDDYATPLATQAVVVGRERCPQKQQREEKCQNGTRKLKSWSFKREGGHADSLILSLQQALGEPEKKDDHPADDEQHHPLHVLENEGNGFARYFPVMALG